MTRNSPVFNQFRVLVSEDNPNIQRLLRLLLLENNCLPTIVGNGRAAIWALLESASYDLVLMDMHMPVMDGIAAAQVIRMLHSPIDRIPIIALSADAASEAQDRALDAGMDDYLEKPINVHALYMAIAYWGDVSRAKRLPPEPFSARAINL